MSMQCVTFLLVMELVTADLKIIGFAHTLSAKIERSRERHVVIIQHVAEIKSHSCTRV